MRQINPGAAAKILASVRRRGWLAVTLLLVCCGGRSTALAPANEGGAASSGSTGLGGSAGQGITVSGGGIQAIAGDANLPAGDAGTAETCDTSQLLSAIRQGAVGGLGICEFTTPPSAGDKIGLLRGAVFLDSEGQVIDNSGLQATTKQAWLDSLMGQKWLCLAGQTLGYKCGAAG